jgi:hypothetical protein
MENLLMLKVLVTYQSKVVSQGLFPDQAAVNAWLDSNNDSGVWGKPAGWYYGKSLTDAEKAIATEVQTVDQNGQDLPDALYLLPKQWSAEVTDVTLELAREARIEKYMRRMDFGKRLMAELAEENLERLSRGETTVPELVSAEAKLEAVQRLLLNGSTSLALGALQQISASLTEYPDSLKIKFISKVQAYLATEV